MRDMFRPFGACLGFVQTSHGITVTTETASVEIIAMSSDAIRVRMRRADGGRAYRGRVWPGTVVYPDFARAGARTWWAECHAALFDAGVRGV